MSIRTPAVGETLSSRLPGGNSGGNLRTGSRPLEGRENPNGLSEVTFEITLSEFAILKNEFNGNRKMNHIKINDFESGRTVVRRRTSSFTVKVSTTLLFCALIESFPQSLYISVTAAALARNRRYVTTPAVRRAACLIFPPV